MFFSVSPSQLYIAFPELGGHGSTDIRQVTSSIPLTCDQRYEEFARLASLYQFNRQHIEECDRVIGALEVEHDFGSSDESANTLILQTLADWYAYRVGAIKERRMLELYLGIVLDTRSIRAGRAAGKMRNRRTVKPPGLKLPVSSARRHRH